MSTDSPIEKLDELREFVSKTGQPFLIALVEEAIRQHHAGDTTRREAVDASEGVNTSPAPADASEISDNSLTAVEALTFLVSLKAHKDQFGKTPYYEMWQPKAWERATKALGNESMRKLEREPVDDELRSLLRTGWELSTWAGSVNWRGGENQKEWLDDLRVLIERFQDQSRTYVATHPEGDWRRVGHVD